MGLVVDLWEGEFMIFVIVGIYVFMAACTFAVIHEHEGGSKAIRILASATVAIFWPTAVTVWILGILYKNRM